MRRRFHRLVFAFAAPFLIGASEPAFSSCVGDCDADGRVLVHEVITAVGIALGQATTDACPPADPDGDGTTMLHEVVRAVHGSLGNCDTSTPTPTPEPTATPTAAGTVPTSGSELLPWLQAGRYLDWPAESSVHPSTGPHFGNVRVFLNDVLFDSLEQGLSEHPAGSVAVKELYGSGAELRGWSVMVKAEDQSAGGDAWYWYERFGTTTFADGFGIRGCTVCHSLGRDYVRIPFPLQ